MSVVWGSIPHMTQPSIKLTQSPAALAPVELDPQQAKAAVHRGTPLLIAGGPGTGKTTVFANAHLKCAMQLLSAPQRPRTNHWRAHFTRWPTQY
jgi:DNA polymerase III delta prime subunit